MLVIFYSCYYLHLFLSVMWVLVNLLLQQPITCHSHKNGPSTSWVTGQMTGHWGLTRRLARHSASVTKRCRAGGPHSGWSGRSDPSFGCRPVGPASFSMTRIGLDVVDAVFKHTGKEMLLSSVIRCHGLSLPGCWVYQTVLLCITSY